MPTNSILITDKCAQVINTPGVLITSLDGREKGTQINFMNYKNKKKRYVQYKQIIL